MGEINYTYMDPMLHEINRKFISLADNEVKKNNRILHKIVDMLVANMKQFDKLFEAMFDKIFYGGSFYDGLKVSNPEEYDLDLLLRIPVYAKPVIIESDIPGYLYLQITDWDKFIKQPEFLKGGFTKLKKMMNESFFILQSVVRRWIEGLVNKVLEHYPRFGDYEHLMDVNLDDDGIKKFAISMRKSGPAITLRIRDVLTDKKLDVDFVPAFTFNVTQWPDNYKTIDQPKSNEFFVVPKPPNVKIENEEKAYWRPSFQVQERMILKSLQHLKPTIRLLKKLRDNKKHKKIASYYIKTIFLNNYKEFPVNMPLSAAFMKGLKIYADTVASGKIAYYWNEDNNLIGQVNMETYQNVGRCLQKIINKINNNPGDSLLIASHLLNKEELLKIDQNATTGKKYLKRLEIKAVLNKTIQLNNGEIIITDEDDIKKLVTHEKFRQSVLNDLKQNGLL